MHEQTSDDILVIAKDIEAYFLNHPTATDTVVGITQWWLTRQRYEQSFDKVNKALDLLVGRRKLTEQTNLKGEVIYSYNDSKD